MATMPVDDYVNAAGRDKLARIIHRLPGELEATVVATVLNGGAVGATVRAGG